MTGVLLNWWLAVFGKTSLATRSSNRLNYERSRLHTHLRLTFQYFVRKGRVLCISIWDIGHLE